ncbi:MAG: phosphatidate cytidylyltransferase [Chloroflexi bacterium]|nr:phosphatidate cytidylyltransferase [Chloroflexota bacterium]
MLSDRLAISALLIPIALWVVALGGMVYLAGILYIFLLSALEYARLFRAGQQRPALPLIVGGVLLFIAAQQFPALNPRGLLFALAIIAPLTWHLIDFERGATTSGTDFAVTAGGIFYLGWLGSYFIALRALEPDGMWWLLTAMSAVWLADTGADAFGRTLGRHKMAPRLSPQKTWEGYAGSLFGGAVGAGVLSVFWHIGAGQGSLLTWQTGALLGALIGLLGQVGDLGVSMLKRQIGVKDSGALLAGHGGALDRIDSWLVAVTVGYYFVLALRAIHGG